ncbi:response regulator [Pseudomonas sp. S191]|uniref:response regulator n=1 Tax=Pseudomonas sp. S191 TaxID=579575 RepID=UPI00387AA288
MNNRIIIVDDHPAICLAVRLLLASEGYDVVAEVNNGADALRLVEELNPAIMVLDIGIPVVDGFTVIRRVVAKDLPVKIVVLTGLPSGHLVTRCRQLGAPGFVNKQNELGELVHAIRAVRSQHKYFPDLRIPPRGQRHELGEHGLIELLSNREFGIMQQLLQDMSNKEIAGHLLLSQKTVSTYKARLLRKLNLRSVVDLFEFAKRNGLG